MNMTFPNYLQRVGEIMENVVRPDGRRYLLNPVSLGTDEINEVDRCFFKGVSAGDCAGMLLGDRLLPVPASETEE